MSGGDVNVRITATDETSAAFASANSAARNFGAALGQLAVIAGTATASLAALAAGVALHAAKEADALNDLAQKLGMSVKQLASYKLAAEQSGVSLQQIGLGIKALSVQMLAHGDAFRKMGIDTQDADKALKQLADVFASMPDGMEKTALATKLFGRAGYELIPMLNLGSRGLAEAAEKSRKFAETMEILAPQANQVGEKISELQIVAQALGANLAIAVVPKLNEVATAMALAAREGGLIEAVLVGIGGAMDAFIEPWRFAWKQVEADMLSFAAKFDAWRAKILFGTAEENALRSSMQNNLQAAGLYGEIAAWNSGKPKALPKASDPMLPGANSAKEIAAQQAALRALYLQEAKTGKAAKAAPPFDPQGDFEYSVFEANEKAKRKAADDNAKATDDQIAATEKLRQKYVEMADPLEKYRKELTEIQSLRENGQLTAAQALEAEWKVNEAMDKQLDTMLGLSAATKEQNDIAKELGMTFTSAFEGAIVGGKKFSDVLQGLGQDILRIITRKNITEPLAKGIGSIDWGKLFSFNADGGVYNSPSLSAYSGGIYNSPRLFKFASGAGVFGEAGPEAIMPLKRGADGRLGVEGGGGSVQVNVINNASGTKARAQERNQGGMRIIDVMIEQVESAIAGNVSSGRGALSGALQSSYGLNRAAGAY